MYTYLDKKINGKKNFKSSRKGKRDSIVYNFYIIKVSIYKVKLA